MRLLAVLKLFVLNTVHFPPIFTLRGRQVSQTGAGGWSELPLEG